jgi:hypothetical protein
VLFNPTLRTEIMSKRIVLAAAALALAPLFAQPALAMDGKHEGRKKMDTNGDGMLSRDEAASRPRLSQHFDKIDANKDGQLSREEMQAFHKEHAGKRGPKPAPAPAQ